MASLRPQSPVGVFARLLLVLLACLLLAACSRVSMYSDLEERQANEVLAALLSADIGADKRTSLSKTGWEIRVERGDFARAMQVLQARGLPRQQYATMCDVFKKEGFASSALELKARYICSRQQELSRTLASYPGVIEARVHIALQEGDQLNGGPGDSSAAVVIFQQPGSNLENLRARIKTVVKDGIEGLEDINQVSVEFVSMPGLDPSQQPQRQAAPAVMSSAMPFVIGAGVLALLALVWAAWGRWRQRAIQPATGDGGGIWKG